MHSLEGLVRHLPPPSSPSVSRYAAINGGPTKADRLISLLQWGECPPPRSCNLERKWGRMQTSGCRETSCLTPLRLLGCRMSNLGDTSAETQLSSANLHLNLNISSWNETEKSENCLKEKKGQGQMSELAAEGGVLARRRLTTQDVCPPSSRLREVNLPGPSPQ